MKNTLVSDRQKTQEKESGNTETGVTYVRHNDKIKRDTIFVLVFLTGLHCTTPRISLLQSLDHMQFWRIGAASPFTGFECQ